MASRKPLPADATLASIADDIPDAEEFVRNVLHHMRGYGRDCEVTLALDGSPKHPDYMISMLFDDVDDEGIEYTHPQSMAVVKGRWHKAEEAYGQNMHRPWASVSMRFIEVQALIGHLRGITRQS